MGRIEKAIRRAQADRVGEAALSSLETTLPTPNGDGSAASRLPLPEQSDAGINLDHLIGHRVVAASAQDDRAGPYRQLRTQLLKMMRDSQWTTLAITSPNEGAGKTLTAANLSISLSRDPNTTVLLVDLDLRTPSVHEIFGLHPQKGLVDYLQGEADLEEIIFSTGFSRLSVLLGRPVAQNASELLASPKMKQLLRALHQQTEVNVTIFDLPALLRNDDAMLFAPYTDATLIVVEDGVTTSEQLETSIRLVEKTNFIGTVLNKAAI